MRPRIRRRLFSSSILLILAAAGCQPPATGVIEKLPDPRLSERRMPRPPALEPTRPARPEPTFPGAEPGWMPMGGISSRWNCIVIHHSANDRDTPQGMAEWHVQRGWDELGYHFVIGDGVRTGDGQVFVGSRWPKQKTGAHCKVPGNYYNEHGIGICLIGNLDRHPPTTRQIESLTRLVSFLMRQRGIPLDRVFTHGGITHKTQCPGRDFSLSAFRRQLANPAISASNH